MSQHAWYEHFKEQLQGLTESFEQNGGSGSLLKYALQEQCLSPDQYLKWAMSHYLLPKLQSQFFTETPISQEMFAKWATHYPWSEECLPVAEWDGALIVACLQPPQDFPSNPQSILVLATPENLQEAWKNLHLQTNPTNKTTQNAAMGPIELIGDPPSEVDDLTHTKSQFHIPTEEQPEGLFDGPTVVQLRPLSSTTPESVTLEKATSEESNIDENTLSIIDMPTTSGVSIEKTAVAERPRPSQTLKPKQAPILTGYFVLEKFRHQNPELLNKNVKKILDDMKSHFQKSLILTLDNEATQLSVFAWDESFQDIKDTSTRISVENPSIFSIVAKTQKPYHGYISVNEVNEQFFTDWNQGQIPDHITLTPLMFDDHMVGMVLGIGDKTAYNKSTLKFVEKLSADFTNSLKAA